MKIIYHNLTVRNAVPEDAALLASWWNDGKIMAHAGFPKGLGKSPQKVAEELRQDSDKTGRRLIAELHSIPIGEMNYRNLGDQTAEISIKICQQEKLEKGLGRILLSMLIQSLFTDFSFKKIRLDTNLKNKRAQHVYGLLGFRKTGVRIDSWTDQMGIKQSAVDYELTPSLFHTFLQESD